MINPRRHTRDDVRVWRSTTLPGVELLDATVDEHVFPRHAHDALAIGAVVSGTAEFWCRGAMHRAPPDTLLLLPAGEVHTGGRWRSAAADGRPTRHYMIYIERSALSWLTGGQARSPRDIGFRTVAAHSSILTAALRRVCDACETPGATLEQETRLVELIQDLARTYGTDRERCDLSSSFEHRAVVRVVEFLAAHVGDDVSLATLSSLVSLHPVYLTRVFRRATGLPPHAYQLHLRLSGARRQLALGDAPSRVAQAFGFTDQSHFTKHFRRAFGISPGRYRAAVAAGP